MYNDVFSWHGLVLHFERGKTEALFRFNGKGAVKARQELLLENRGTITFESRGRNIDLVATSTYKHVGTLTCSSDSLQPEISVKLAAMTNTFKLL